MTLDELRVAIDEVDDKILDLLANRGKLVDAAWRQKTAAGRAPVDAAREAHVLARHRARGEPLGLDPADVERIWRAILRVRVR